MATRRWTWCLEKRAYASREEAEARRVEANRHDKVSYRCHLCDAFHLGWPRRRRMSHAKGGR